jgi:hypothetical protein
MQAEGLPLGLRLNNCKTTTSNIGAFIKCEISGRPFGFGNYQPTITLKDNKGGIFRKTLKLKIKMPRNLIPLIQSWI